MVTRGELRERLWPEGTFVDFDKNLNTAIRKLRNALGDDATRPSFIQTLPRRGYRFIARLDGSAEPWVGPRWWRVAAIILAGTLGLVAVPQGPGRNNTPMTVALLPFKNLSGESMQDYIAEGLKAELSAELSRISDARVQLLVGESGKRPADFVVSGTSRRDPTGLYVTASLVSNSGRQVWAETFACPLQDLFGIQRQLAAKIGKQLLANLQGQ